MIQSTSLILLVSAFWTVEGPPPPEGEQPILVVGGGVVPPPFVGSTLGVDKEVVMPPMVLLQPEMTEKEGSSSTTQQQQHGLGKEQIERASLAMLKMAAQNDVLHVLEEEESRNEGAAAHEEEDEDEEDSEDSEDSEDEEYDELYDLPFSWTGYDEDIHTHGDIFEGLGCWELLYDSAEPRPIHTAETWTLLRKRYMQVMQEEASLDRNQVLEGNKNAYQVPIRIEHIQGKGRGVVAAANIPQGTQLYRPHEYTAMFRNGRDFRHYLELLPTDLACEVMMWAFCEYVDVVAGEDLVIGVELDEGSFTNGALTREEINVDTNYIATRDILEGEEIMESYDDFHIESGWEEFGL